MCYKNIMKWWKKEKILKLLWNIYIKKIENYFLSSKKKKKKKILQTIIQVLAKLNKTD